MARAKGIKPMAQNKKAFHDYFVEERIECGMELKGTEVKSMRQGRMNLKESFAIVKDGEVLVCGMHISPYEQGNIFNTDPLRQKKLLLHKSQIRHLGQEVGKMGYSLIPLQVYLKDGRFKMELGLCKGKKLHDKRDDIRLVAGMVIAIEPMINMGTADIKTMPDGWTVKTKDGKWAAHFEHTIAVTPDGAVILTKV